MGYIPRGKQNEPPLKGGPGQRGRPGPPGQSVVGPPGRRGSIWWSSNGAPTSFPGQRDGDWDIDYSTDDYYQLVDGVWTLRGNLSGVGIPEVFVQAAAPAEGLTPWAWFQLDVDGPTGNVEYVKVYQP